MISVSSDRQTSREGSLEVSLWNVSLRFPHKWSKTYRQTRT